MSQQARALSGMGSQRRTDRGGRREKAEHTRSERVAITVYPQDIRDLDVVSRHFNVPISTLCWGVLHDWLAQGREASTELGEVRWGLRRALELAMRDRELGPWIRDEARRLEAEELAR